MKLLTYTELLDYPTIYDYSAIIIISVIEIVSENNSQVLTTKVKLLSALVKPTAFYIEQKVLIV